MLGSSGATHDWLGPLGHLLHRGVTVVFGLSKKKPPQPTPERPPSFVERLIDQVRAIALPDARLVSYVTLWNQLRALEQEYSEHCGELDILRDAIEDAFEEVTDPEVALASAQLLDLFSPLDLAFRHNPEFKALPSPLKLRLTKLHLRSHLDGLERHPTEYEPNLQHAFYELEQDGLDEFEKREALQQRYGIGNWELVRAMNPHVIIEPVLPRDRKGA